MEGERDAGGVSEHQLELARTAKEAFDNHRYESCLSALNRLLDARRHDARVAHNRAVAQYLLSNLTLTDEFRKSLHTVSMQFDRDAENSGMEASISDKGVLLFNQALIHMRLHQNTQAMEILEHLFRVHDALGEHLSVEVSLLLIETYMSTYRLSKAAVQIGLLEVKLYGGPLGGKSEGEGEGPAQQCRPQLHLFKARLHLLHKNVKACKKEVKNFISTAGNFLKANVEFLRQNYRKALKVLGSAPKSPIVTDAGECLSAFYFNNIACVHYQLGKYSLAAHYFTKAIEENDAALNGFPPLDRATPLSGRPLAVLGMNCRHVLLYNLGLQQLYAGHPNAAFDSLLEVVQVYHTNPRLWLRLAEACIASYSKAQQDQARLKLNKSCTVQHVFGSGLHRKMVLTPIQNWVKGRNGIDSHPQSAAMPAPTLEFAAICLRNALFLLPPMSALLASASLTPIEEEGEGSQHPPSIPALPGPPIQGQDIINLRCSVLACLAYVNLGLGDPVPALSYARQLLAMPKLLGGLKFLGQTYAAEALVQLGRVLEALQLLSPDSVGDITVSLPTARSQHGDHSETSQFDRPASRPTSALSEPSVLQFPDSLGSARAVMLFNLSGVYCLKGEVEKARKLLQQSASLFGEVPPQVVLLSAYIELMSGNTSAALQIIKKNQPFPANMTDKRKSKKSTYLSLRQ